MGRPVRPTVEGTSGRIIELLRRSPLTVDQMAAALQLTSTAIRSQIAALERDAIVERRGSQPGASKPARLYGVTAQTELLFSRAYIPILSQLLHVLAARVPPSEFDAMMRDVGRGAMAGRLVNRGDVGERAHAASELLNELGGLSHVEKVNGSYMIRSAGCPLAAATSKYPEACNAIESMLSEFAGLPVRKCCERTQRAECCFEITS